MGEAAAASRQRSLLGVTALENVCRVVDRALAVPR